MARLIPDETWDEAMNRITKEVGHGLKESLPLVEQYIRRWDPHWGRRSKSTSGIQFWLNQTGKLWDIWWHFEPTYATWVFGWLAVQRGMQTNKIRGLQIWWPPLRFGKLIWSRK